MTEGPQIDLRLSGAHAENAEGWRKLVVGLPIYGTGPAAHLFPHYVINGHSLLRFPLISFAF